MDQQEEPASGEPRRRAGVEARAHRRYRCRENSVVYLAVRPSFHSFPALARDVSVGGLGLLLDRPLNPGTVLALQLRGGRPGTSVTRMARVVHVRRHLPVKNPPWVKKKRLFRGLLAFLTPRSGNGTPDEDCIWLMGCSLSPPLSEDELEGLRGAEG
jgi:hypothetical protein